MSGVVKAVKKVFSWTIASVLKPIIKPLIVLAAVYFTAGLAIGAFSPALAASMPGFAGGGLAGLGVGAGATAGTGIFSSIAAHLGVTGMASIGAANTAAAAAAAGAVATASDAAAFGASATPGAIVGANSAALAPVAAGGVAGSTAAGAAGTAASGGVATAMDAASFGATATPGALAAATPGALAPVAAGGVSGAASGWASMSLGDKLLLASTGSKLVSGLLAPSPADVARANKTWVGAFYGVDANGAGAAPAEKPTQAQPAAMEPVQATTTLQPQVGLTPGSQVASTLPTSATGTKAVPADVANARNLIATNAANTNQGGAPPAGTGYQFGVEGQPQAGAGNYQFGANGYGANNLIPGQV